MNPFLERFVSALIHYRWPLFGLALFLAALAWFPSRFVRFDRSIENMFAPDDPLIPPYLRLKRDFGGNEVIMAVYQDDHLLDPDGRGLARLAEITERIETVPGIDGVLSLSKINDHLKQLEKTKNLGGVLDLFREGNKPAPEPILDQKNPLASRFRDLFSSYTHSADGRTAAILCMVKPHSTPHAPREGIIARSEMTTMVVPREKTIGDLQNIIQSLPDNLPPGFLAGEPVMLGQGFSILEADARRLGIYTTLLLGLTILIFFRSLRWLVIPIAVVQWSLLTTRAVLVVSGLQLSMVSSMLTAIVTVVGVATVMHLIVHVRELRTQGLTQRAALQTASLYLAGPIVGAILTDMAGFGALCWSSVQPVRDFGTMMVIGSLLVIPATCLLTPALALLAARDQPTPRPGWSEVHIGHWLMRSIDAIRARPKTVAALVALIAVVSSLGVLRLDVETDFTRNFRADSSVVRSYEFVETHLGGAGVWDIILPAPAILDEAYLAKIRHLQERLRDLKQTDPTTGQAAPALTKVLSLVDALDAASADPTLAALTPTPELRYQGLAAAMPTFMNAMRSAPDEHGNSRLRIMLRARERQPAAQKRQLINLVTQITREEFPPLVVGTIPSPRRPGSPDPATEVTGFFVLLTNLIQSLLRDQWITFGIASAAIMLLVWLGFRSWQYAVVAMIPNAVPIYMVMGLLGWLGLKMNMGAVMIAAVSMGMSVDSSIHYYAAFRRHRREGKSVHAALVQCQQSVGLAMIFSTVALIVGFGVLITSDFVPTIYFGALMSLAMLGGLLGNLLILPLLLSWTEKDP